MKKIQTTLQSFTIKPKGESGDFSVKLTFEAQEGPGMLDEILSDLGPLLKKEVVLKIDPMQMRINEATGEVKIK